MQKPTSERLEPRRLLAAVTVVGTSAIDVIRVAVNAVDLVVTVNGLDMHYDKASTTLTIETSDGNDVIDIDSLGSANATTVRGGDGDDTLTLAGPSGDLQLVQAEVFFDAQAGAADRAVLKDGASVSAATYVVGLDGNNDVFRVGFGGFVHRNTESARLEAGSAADTFWVYNSFAGTRYELAGNGGADVYEVFSTGAAGNGSVAVIEGGAGDDDVWVRPTSNQNAVAEFRASDQIARFRVDSSGTLRLTNHAAVRLSTTNSNVAGTLDVGDGAILEAGGAGVEDGPYFAGMVARGLSGAGAPRVISSAADASPQSDGVGLGYGSDVARTSVGPFAIAADDLLITRALQGDSNLDGTVNFGDLLRLAQSYNGEGLPPWTSGDSNYDDAVNFSDLLALAQNYGGSLSAAPGSAPVAAPGVEGRTPRHATVSTDVLT